MRLRPLTDQTSYYTNMDFMFSRTPDTTYSPSTLTKSGGYSNRDWPPAANCGHSRRRVHACHKWNDSSLSIVEKLLLSLATLI